MEGMEGMEGMALRIVHERSTLRGRALRVLCGSVLEGPRWKTLLLWRAALMQALAADFGLQRIAGRRAFPRSSHPALGSTNRCR